VSTEDNLDLARAEETLNEDHYGLEKVKQRILDFLAVRKLRPDATRAHPLLCGAAGHGQDIPGPVHRSGVGAQVPAPVPGGIRDEAEIRGHAGRTWAPSGRFIQEIRRAGSNNPLIILDEVD